jgi:hypothetical protein
LTGRPDPPQTGDWRKGPVAGLERITSSSPTHADH